MVLVLHTPRAMLLHPAMARWACTRSSWKRMLFASLLLLLTLPCLICICCAGAIMLQRRANTSILNSTFTSNRARSGGGSLCTVVAGGPQENFEDRRDDLQTMLEVHHVIFNGTGAADRLLVGPYFILLMSGINLTSGVGTDYNRTTPGIVHRRRLCDQGQYLSASTNYCEECPPFQYSYVEPMHEQRTCTPATELAVAPGGAVLVPISGGEARTSKVCASFAACMHRLIARMMRGCCWWALSASAHIPCAQHAPHSLMAASALPCLQLGMLTPTSRW